MNEANARPPVLSPRSPVLSPCVEHEKIRRISEGENMRTLFAIVVFSLLAASSAVAGVTWGGAGWYQVVSDEGSPTKEFWAGPFSSESACQSTLPSNNSLSSYSCKYFQNDPGY